MSQRSKRLLLVGVVILFAVIAFLVMAREVTAEANWVHLDFSSKEWSEPEQLWIVPHDAQIVIAAGQYRPFSKLLLRIDGLDGYHAQSYRKFLGNFPSEYVYWKGSHGLPLGDYRFVLEAWSGDVRWTPAVMYVRIAGGG